MPRIITQDALTPDLPQRAVISFSGITDLKPSIARLNMKGSLGAGELLNIAKLLETVKNAAAYNSSEDDDMEADSLDEIFEALVPLNDLLREIRRCIISEEEISDDASSALKSIRRSMKQAQSENPQSADSCCQCILQSG